MPSRWRLRRRTLLQGLGATAVMPLAMPALAVIREPIRFAVLVPTYDPGGRNQFSSYFKGATSAVAEINASDGACGRRIQIETHPAHLGSVHGIPDALRAAADSKPHAIGNAANGYCTRWLGTFEAPYFAAADYCRLYDNLRTERQQPIQAPNFFEVASPTAYRAQDLPRFLDLVADRRGWNPSGRTVHVVRAQSDGETRIADEVAARISTSTFRVASVTNVADTIQDWSPVLHAIEDSDPSVVVIDHRLRAEGTPFPRHFFGPREGEQIYLQYAPIELYNSNLADVGVNSRFFWSTARGLFSDENSLDALRVLVCTTGVYLSSRGIDSSDEAGYAAARTLGYAWQAVEPENFAAMTEHLRSHIYPFPHAHFSGRPNFGYLPPDRGHSPLLQSAA